MHVLGCGLGRSDLLCFQKSPLFCPLALQSSSQCTSHNCHRLFRYRVRSLEAASSQPSPLFMDLLIALGKPWLQSLLWSLVFRNTHQTIYFIKKQPGYSAPRLHHTHTLNRKKKNKTTGPEDLWLVICNAGESPKEQRDVLGIQAGQKSAHQVPPASFPPPPWDSPPFRLPVSRWHQPHFITTLPCIKILGDCCLEEMNPRSLFNTSAPTFVLSLSSSLISPGRHFWSMF